MSIFFAVIFSANYLDCDTEEKIDGKCPLEEVNKVIIAEGHSPLTSVDDEKLPKRWYGGNERFMAQIYIGCFDALMILEIFAAVLEQKWYDRDAVQILMKGEDDDAFLSYSLEGMAKWLNGDGL